MNIPDPVSNAIDNLLSLNNSIQTAYNQKKKWEDDIRFLKNQFIEYDRQITYYTNAYNLTYEAYISSYNTYLTYIDDYNSYMSNIDSYFTYISNFIDDNKYCRYEQPKKGLTYDISSYIVFNNYTKDDIYNIKYNKIEITNRDPEEGRQEKDEIIKTSNIIKLNNFKIFLKNLPSDIITRETLNNYINKTLELNQ